MAADAPMADSTRAMRRAIFERDVLPKWKQRFLTEITAKTSAFIAPRLLIAARLRRPSTSATSSSRSTASRSSQRRESRTIRRTMLDRLRSLVSFRGTGRFRH